MSKIVTGAYRSFKFQSVLNFQGADMNRLKITWIFLFVMIFPLICLSTSDLSAQQIEDNEEISDKPPSFAQSRLDAEPVDLITETYVAEFYEEQEEYAVNHVLISLADQQMWVFEGDTILQRFSVSTGVPGHRTPTGEYSVRNRSLRAYSNKYDAWMLHWMAITPDGLYGMHGLQGTSYLRHLGSVASHGCIRLSHEDAEWLYSWVDIGLRVEIVSDWEEPPEEKEIPFRAGKFYCL